MTSKRRRGAGASPPPSYSFISAGNATVSGSDLSRASISVTAGLLLILVSGRAAGNFQITGVNVGSDAATEIIRTPSGFRNPSAIYARVITAPATVTITATTGGTSPVGTIALLTLTGLSSNTPIDTDNNQSGSGATSSSLPLTLTDGAIGIWVSTHREPENVTWTDATELHDTAASGGNHQHSSAAYQASSALTRTAVATWATSDEWSMVAAAFR